MEENMQTILDVVTGPPGVGKSHIMDELKAQNVRRKGVIVYPNVREHIEGDYRYTRETKRTNLQTRKITAIQERILRAGIEFEKDTLEYNLPDVIAVILNGSVIDVEAFRRSLDLNYISGLEEALEERKIGGTRPYRNVLMVEPPKKSRDRKAMYNIMIEVYTELGYNPKNIYGKLLTIPSGLSIKEKAQMIIKEAKIDENKETDAPLTCRF